MNIRRLTRRRTGTVTEFTAGAVDGVQSDKPWPYPTELLNGPQGARLITREHTAALICPENAVEWAQTARASLLERHANDLKDGRSYTIRVSSNRRIFEDAELIAIVSQIAIWEHPIEPPIAD